MMTKTWALAILLQPALGEKSINIFGHIEFNRICCFCREEFGSHSIGFIEACCILLFLNKKIKNGMHFFFFFFWSRRSNGWIDNEVSAKGLVFSNNNLYVNQCMTIWLSYLKPWNKYIQRWTLFKVLFLNSSNKDIWDLSFTNVA